MRKVLISVASAVLLTSFLGGCITPDMTGWSDQQIISYYEGEDEALRQLTERANQPMFPNGLPSYSVPSNGPYVAPNQTIYINCNQVTDRLATCRAR